MKMKTLNLYRVLRTRRLLKVFIMTAVALHFGFGGWNELLFYSTAPKHKSIGTTSLFLGATDDDGKIIMKMKISKLI